MVLTVVVQISDFGLSRWKQYSFEMSGRNNGGGTVTHIPPENWNDINLPRNEKFDVYSFGVLLWEVFSEKRPFLKGILSTLYPFYTLRQKPWLGDMKGVQPVKKQCRSKALRAPVQQ